MKSLTKTTRIFYGIGIVGIGVQQFMYLEFRPVIFPASPSWIRASAIIACLVGAALVVAGIFIALNKKAKTTSLFLGGFLLALLVFFQCPYVLFIQPNLAYHLGLWTDPLKELALGGGAFIMAGLADDELIPRRNYILTGLEKLIPFGKVFFSITMISFGIDHFFYTEFVAGLVPSWFPDHVFWTYFAGVALIASGVSIILQIKIRSVALLLSTMLFLWLILLHIPRAIADPFGARGNEITSVFEDLAFSGVALGIAIMYSTAKRATGISLGKSELQYEKEVESY